MSRVQIASDAIKAAPAVVGAGLSATFYGMAWADVASALTALYVLIMIIQNVWSHWARPLLVRLGLARPKPHKQGFIARKLSELSPHDDDTDGFGA